MCCGDAAGREIEPVFMLCVERVFSAIARHRRKRV
jgi:hypothetical protein